MTDPKSGSVGAAGNHSPGFTEGLIMDEYDALFIEENDENMRDVRERKARVSEMYKRFDTDPQLWKESRAILEAEGWKFVDVPASKARGNV